MKVLTFLLGALISASSVLSFPTLSKQVPPQCADPTFACQDLESARLCGVVKSCIHDIWATMSAPDDNDEICDICKEMVKEARDQLLSNMTQEEIKEVFEGSCKLLPIKLVADACIKVVDEIIPELVEMLASRMDPTMVCTVSGLCNMAHLPFENHILKFMQVVLTGHLDDQCSECTQMMTDVKTFLKTTPEGEVKTYAEKFCAEKVPSYLCDVLIGTYLPQVYSYIISSDPRSMCSTVGICPQKCNSNKQYLKVKDELTCEFCEHVLEHVKQMIIANTTMEEFRTALLNFCQHTGSFSSKCTSLVNDYYDMLFDYIKNLDTKGLCTLIGLCDNNRCTLTPLVKLIPALETRNRIPLIKIQPAVHIPSSFNIHPLVKIRPAMTQSKKEMHDSNEIFQASMSGALPVERFEHPILNFEQDTECAFCRAISFYLQQDLNGDKSKVEVKQAISNVCDKWVKDFPGHCQNFLNKYSTKVQYAIAEDIDFEGICRHVKACPLEDRNLEVNVKVISKIQSGPFCDLCKDVVGELENKLKDPAIKQKVENFMNQYCNLLPQTFRDDCINFLDRNMDEIFNILEQELNPNNICPALRLCTSAPRVAAPQNIKGMECDICKDLVSSFRQRLQDPSSKQTIQNFLEEVCAKLPGPLSSECKTFIDENIDTAIGIFIQVMDPDTVCSLLNICPASVKKVKPQKLKNLQCDLCKEVVEKVEDMIKDKKTEDEIKAALDKVCSYLPSSIAQKCENFVNQYTDLLIMLLSQELDPQMVCAELKVCPAGEKQDEWQAKAQDMECQTCQYALHFLQEQLENADTQAEVKNLFKKICDVLPETYAKNCEAFVDEYGNAFLALLAQQIDPNTLCWKLQMCSNHTKLFSELTKIQLHPLAIDRCSMCTTVVDYMDKLIEEDDIDKEITAVIEKVCTVIPASYKDQCSTIIETYGPYILQMIGQMANSKEVCQDIDLCPTPHGHVHLLGGHKCTFGPSYWCTTAAHAAACKAEMFCKQKVWKQ